MKHIHTKLTGFARTLSLIGLIDGSGHQLWSAAAFLNVCIRAGLVA